MKPSTKLLKCLIAEYLLLNTSLEGRLYKKQSKPTPTKYDLERIEKAKLKRLRKQK